MSKKINKADKLVFKALQRAIADDRLHICLINSKINIPSSPVYNPWEVLLPTLIPVLLGLILGANFGPFTVQPTTIPPISTDQTTSINQNVTPKPTNS